MKGLGHRRAAAAAAFVVGWVGSVGLIGLGAGCGSTCDTATEDCDDGGSGGDGDEGIQIDDLRWGCCEAGTAGCDRFGTYWYSLSIEGHAGMVELTVLESAAEAVPWTEAQNLPRVQGSASQGWEDHYLELPSVDTSACASRSDCADAWKQGKNTLFTCAGPATAEATTWVLRLYEREGGKQRGCRAWGLEADTIESCVVITP